MEPGLSELYQQVERGALFAHSVLSEGFAHLYEMQAFVYALGDLLIAKGIVSETELAGKIANVRAELKERGELRGPGLVARFDEDDAATKPAVEVDCKARMHVCNAVCCRLDFALNIAEVESTHVQWDIGRPYFIRHDGSGRCVHNDAQCGGCNIYAHRPRVCRAYDCSRDERIWKDFDRMELNRGWIEANLPGRSHTRAHVVSLQPVNPGENDPGKVNKGEDGASFTPP
jgi:Fe-S-cluster containining protein